jgi:ABC-type spermidine/putrescine transport system permease subunit I
MQLLLPHSYKTKGMYLVPLGLVGWLAMQLGVFTKLLSGYLNTSTIHVINVAIAILGFFGFLLGLYFLAFSKEKMEDEMVQKIRLESLQFAALLQMITLILGFLLMLVLGEPKENGFLLFFVCLFLFFWLSFIIRFNYLLKGSNDE